MLDSIVFVILEAILCTLIISYVPYTEIDWLTYMQHVRLLIRGVRDYKLITGDTGPCVYPAGFLYIFTVLYALTNGGRNILRGQWIFAVIFMVQCFLIAFIFRQCNVLIHHLTLLDQAKVDCPFSPIEQENSFDLSSQAL
jgi:alpha-1,3-mannosyltransferase